MLLILLFALSLSGAPQDSDFPEGSSRRFSFGIGVQTGLGTQGTTGIIGSMRFLGAAGFDLEYDFNRVTSTPSRSSRAVEDLKFYPNFKLEGIVHFFRETQWSPWVLFGLGVDLGADFSRSNMQFGGGVDIFFWQQRVVFTLGLRVFVPWPVDVERQREYRIMDGNPVLPPYTDYYNFDCYQFLISVRYFY